MSAPAFAIFAPAFPFISSEAGTMTEEDKKLGMSMAKWGALGALVAIPVPFVGPIIGAAVGAGYAYYKGKKTG
jgi:hypothetical protein